jgi:hypothetical protein
LRDRLVEPMTGWTLRRWVVAWLGASVLGIVNGGIRDFAYEERVGESAAGQISTGTLIALLALHFWVLQRRWPLASRRDALSAGAIWIVLTVLFEFGFGSAVEGLAWGEMLEPYDVTKGNVWILVLLWIAPAPRPFARSKASASSTPRSSRVSSAGRASRGTVAGASCRRAPGRRTRRGGSLGRRDRPRARTRPLRG